MKFSYELLKKIVPNLPAKQKIAETFSLHVCEVEEVRGDTLQINLPANRYSDLASHIGVARESAAAFNLSFKNPVKKIINLPEGLGLLKVEIKEKGLAPRYAARLFEIPKYKAAPVWIKKSLVSCGIKPISGIVDTMNFVMLETGQPLHAFDADKVQGGIVVRLASEGEKIETLDGGRHTLSKDVLVIADKERALAIAGIKGGAYAGVSKDTKRIIVEAANFGAASVFQTSKALKLETDAAIRFRHGISPTLVEWGMDRATELLSEYGAKLLDSVDVYEKPRGGGIIGFSAGAYEKLVGEPVSLKEAESIFKKRGFTVQNRKKDKFLVRIPAWRTDVEEPEDLIEEISRFKGYNELMPKAPLVSLGSAIEEDITALKDVARETLVRLGLNEVLNYSFVGEKEPEMLSLENPISRDLAYLRKDLVKGLLKNVEENARFMDDINIFEIGDVFRATLRENVEEIHLGVCLAKKKQARILEIKGVMRELFSAFGLIDFLSEERNGALRIESDHKVIGEIKTVSLDKNWVATLAEFNLSKILDIAEGEKEYSPLSKFPAVMRDVSLILDLDARIGEIVEIMQESDEDIVDVDLIDEYVDEKLGGEQSLTFRIVFQADDRTLTDSEVNRALEKMLHSLRQKFRVEVR